MGLLNARTARGDAEQVRWWLHILRAVYGEAPIDVGIGHEEPVFIRSGELPSLLPHDLPAGSII